MRALAVYISRAQLHVCIANRRRKSSRVIITSALNIEYYRIVQVVSIGFCMLPVLMLLSVQGRSYSVNWV